MFLGAKARHDGMKSLSQDIIESKTGSDDLRYFCWFLKLN